MSYESVNTLSSQAKMVKVQELIELLGYKKSIEKPHIPEIKAIYYWFEQNEYRSWSGIGLQISKKEGQLEVYTRTSSSSSYWDNLQQNKTIKMLREYFGGYFVTDAGRNRYHHPEKPIPSTTSSGCFLARWRFHNALTKVHVYMQNRNLAGPICRDEPSGFEFLDDLNPRLLSNNLILPYVIAVWEEYFRSTFEVLFNTLDNKENVLKEVRLTAHHLEPFADDIIPFSRAVSGYFSFQRPSLISRNFKLVRKDIDITGALRKPYRRRKISLFNSIEILIENRNSFVHEGKMDTKLFDVKIKSIINDITEAVNRTYNEIGLKYSFTPIHDY